MKGWMKLHRQLLEWEWYDDINTKVLFLHLLLTANYEEKKWRSKLVKKGERITSLQKLAKETGLSVQQVRTSLKKLETTGELTRKSTNEYTHITLEKWEKYQDKDQNTTRKSTNGQQTNNKRITTTKESKKEKKEKNKEKHIGADKPLSDIQKLVHFFFEQKGWQYDNSKQATFRRHLKPAKDLLEVCEGNLETAKHKIRQIKYWADQNELDWSIDTVLKKWFELDRLAANVEKSKKAYIGRDRAYQDKDGRWNVILPSGEHRKYIGSLENLRYE